MMVCSALEYIDSFSLTFGLVGKGCSSRAVVEGDLRLLPVIEEEILSAVQGPQGGSLLPVVMWWLYCSLVLEEGLEEVEISVEKGLEEVESYVSFVGLA